MTAADLLVATLLQLVNEQNKHRERPEVATYLLRAACAVTDAITLEATARAVANAPRKEATP